MKGRYENSSVFVKLLQWFGTMALLTAVALVIYRFLPNPQSVTSLKILQLLQTFSIFLLPPLIVAWLWSRQPMEWLYLNRAVSWKTGALAVLLMVTALPAINLIAYWNQQMVFPEALAPLEQFLKRMEETAAQLIEQFMQGKSLWGFLGNLVLMALLPALSEELTFRGVLQNLLAKRGTAVAVWVTAFIFSAIHLQFYGFLPRLLMGALFGYALLWSKSLWLPVLMHFTNNAMVICAYCVANRYGLDIKTVDNLGTGATLWLGILSLLLTIVWIYLLFHHLRRTTDNPTCKE